MAKENREIDLVYMWVDGSDPAWLARKLAATGEFREGSETDDRARYENSDELKYSLRSAEKNAPWIRRIFIVTDGQTPAWLDTSNPRVRIVDHTEIMPPESLPCYNASVIEYFLYRIPDLAERFLLSNDDTFFGTPLSPGFFFADDGYPIVRLRRKRFWKLRHRIKELAGADVGHYRRMIFDLALAVERLTGRFYSGIPHHNIDAYTKSDYRRAVEEIFRDEVERSQCHRVRTEGDFHRSAITLWILGKGHAHLEMVDNATSCHIHLNDPDFMSRYQKHHPHLFCLNDNQRATAQDRSRIKPFLETLFPDRSPFEK